MKMKLFTSFVDQGLVLLDAEWDYLIGVTSEPIILFYTPVQAPFLNKRTYADRNQMCPPLKDGRKAVSCFIYATCPGRLRISGANLEAVDAM